MRVVPEDEQYIVNWHTDEFDLSSAATYRITVLVSGTELGFGDVQLGASGSEAKNLTTNETIGLKDGRTLPIKFRIEEGAVFVVPVDEDVTVEALGGEVVLEIPAGALTEETGITVEPLPPTPEVQVLVDLGPDGTQFTTPVPVTIGFNPATLPPGVGPVDLVFVYSNGADPRQRAYPGSVNGFPLTNTVTAELEGFSTGGAGTAPLAIFCPGDSDPSTYDDLAAALADVMDGGTVEVCAGNHDVPLRVIVDKPVTIEGAAGTRPTLTTGGADIRGFVIRDTGPGTVTVRNLHLVFDCPTTICGANLSSRYPLGLNGSTDQVAIDDVTIDLLVRSDGTTTGSGIYVRQSDVAGAHTVIHNVTITGGVRGVSVWSFGTGAENSPLDILNSTISGAGFGNIGVFPFAPTTSRTTIQNVTLDGGGAALAVFSSPASAAGGVRVDVLDSDITGGAIWFQSGATGLIQNNTIDGCHPNACIRVQGTDPSGTAFQPEPVRVIGNQLTAPAGVSENGLRLTNLNAGPFEARNNTIGGDPLPATGDPARTDPFTYSYHGVGIRVENPEVAGTVSDNSISSAFN
ncbi:MAG: hypothetical protein ACYSUI_25495, partial [Planctomycetota bacterium]